MAPRMKHGSGGIPHYRHDAPHLRQAHNPKTDVFDPMTMVGQWYIVCSHNCMVKVAPNDRRPVRLMLLLTMKQDASDGDARFILPVGQELVAPDGDDPKDPDTVDGDYCTVMHESVLYHVLVLQKYKKGK
jgi:hypothetical protein